LARKYRPKSFADVAVQSHVSSTLKGAIARGRVAHGYLLCGPRGVGKTTLARVLAMALNCETLAASRRAGQGGSAEGEPCGTCPSCQRIWSGSASLDVVEIDAASNRGVDDARELRERAMYAPSGDDRYKVYIVDEAHMLTREAWNALLKILEEPPPRVVFVFATTEPQKIAQQAAPVLSRLQRFDLKRIGAADIRARLSSVLAAEGATTEPDAVAMIARAADGSMRDALSLADQVLSLGDGALTTEAVRQALGLVPEDEYVALLDLVAGRRAGDVFDVVARLADAGVDFGGFLAGFADVLRAQLAIVLGGDAPEVSERARAALVERRAALSAADLLRMLHAIAELEPRFRRSGQQRLLLETLLVRFALLERSIAIEDVLRGLDGEGGAGAARRDSSPRPAPPAGPAARGGRPPVAEDTGAAPRGGAGDWRAVLGGEGGRGAQGSVRAGAVADVATAAPPPPVRRVVPPAAPMLADERLSSETTGSGAAVAVAAAPAPPTAASAPAVAPLAPVVGIPDLNVVAERWDEVVERVRESGKAAIAAVLSHTLPVAISGKGIVALQLEEPNEIWEQALEAGREDVVAALRELFGGIERVTVRGAEGAAPVAPAKRMTAESIREERVAAMRKKDPVLGAAIDELDLELMD
ncbi:MAG TPA: DNA polymerase III subunit gamma/tau, partial [Gemmatimonadaceae bacterium]